MFQELCKFLEQKKWHYDVHDGKYIQVTAQGEDLPVTLLVWADDRSGVVKVMSSLPFEVSAARTADICVALAVINRKLAVGRFDCDLVNGKVNFLVNYFYKDCVFDPDLYAPIFHGSCKTIDDFNVLLMMLSQEKLSLEDFLRKVCDEEVRA